MLNLYFWFDVRPSVFVPVIFWVLLVVFVALVLAAIYLSWRSKKNYKETRNFGKLFAKLVNWSTTVGVVGLILVFFKQSHIVYLGMRIWLALWLVIAVVWLGFIVKYYLVEVPKIRKEIEQKEQLRKYL